MSQRFFHSSLMCFEKLLGKMKIENDSKNLIQCKASKDVPLIPFLIQDRQEYIQNWQVYIQSRQIAIYKFKIDNIHSRLKKLDFRLKTEVNSVLTYFKTWQAFKNMNIAYLEFIYCNLSILNVYLSILNEKLLKVVAFDPLTILFGFGRNPILKNS